MNRATAAAPSRAISTASPSSRSMSASLRLVRRSSSTSSTRKVGGSRSAGIGRTSAIHRPTRRKAICRRFSASNWYGCQEPDAPVVRTRDSFSLARSFCAIGDSSVGRVDAHFATKSATNGGGTSLAMCRVGMSADAEKFNYDDATVRKFVFATAVWGVVATLVGLWLALMLVMPQLNLGLAQLSFGRLRPLHTNAAIFAFAGNAIFAAIYYSTQRLLKARMFSDALSKFHFWGWQAIIVSAALTLPLRHHPGQGVRRARVADRHRDRRRLGGFRRELLRHDREAPRAAHLRRDLVLHRDHHHRRDSAHLQQPRDARRPCSRATRSTPACRTRSCSGGTATTPSRSS